MTAIAGGGMGREIIDSLTGRISPFSPFSELVPRGLQQRLPLSPRGLVDLTDMQLYKPSSLRLRKSTRHVGEINK